MGTIELAAQFSHRHHSHCCRLRKHENIHLLLSFSVHVHFDVDVGIIHCNYNATTQKRKTRWESGSRDRSGNAEHHRIPLHFNECVGLLQTCTHVEELKQLHAHMLRGGLQKRIGLWTKLVTMYAVCGSMENARQVFDKICKRDVFLWNSMIREYARNGPCEEALTLCCQMHREGKQPDNFTFPFLLNACACLSTAREGEMVHAHTVRTGFESDVYVGVGLIHMYAACECIQYARQVFDKMSTRDLASWNAMITGYVHNVRANEALAVFHQMQLSDIKPDSVTMVSVLPACAQLAALQHGKSIHGFIIKSGLESDVFVGNALIDMYAKCGHIEIVPQLFDRMSERTVVSWNTMIAGYGMHGYVEDALALFGQLQLTGIKPNHITFIGVLSACSHAGLVDVGRQYFDSMSRDYCIAPRVEHYACMVDLLGRAGHLDEAQNFIKNMPVEPTADVWGALLGACRIHGNIALGERVADCLFDLMPDNDGYYVLLSNMYAVAGRWDDVAKVRAMMRDRRLKRRPGCSLIEINNKVHSFFVGDRLHPQSEKIYALSETLAGQMEEAGYVRSINLVFHDVE